MKKIIVGFEPFIALQFSQCTNYQVCILLIPIINTECTIITDIGVHRFNSGVGNQIMQTLGRSVHNLIEGKVTNLKVANKNYQNKCTL